MDAIIETRFGLNAKPPINHDEKYAHAERIKSEIEEFLASGGKIEKLESVGIKTKPMTYKEVNDSTYIGAKG